MNKNYVSHCLYLHYLLNTNDDNDFSILKLPIIILLFFRSIFLFILLYLRLLNITGQNAQLPQQYGSQRLQQYQKTSSKTLFTNGYSVVEEVDIVDSSGYTFLT